MNNIHECHVTIVYWVREYSINRIFGIPSCLGSYCKAYGSREAAGKFIEENTKNLPEGHWYEVHIVENADADWEPHRRERWGY